MDKLTNKVILPIRLMQGSIYLFQGGIMNINPLQSARMAQKQAKAMENVRREEAKSLEQNAEKSRIISNNKQNSDLPKTTKSNYKMDTNKLAELKAQFSQQTSSFQAMIRRMFEQQGIKANQAGNYQDLFDKVVVSSDTQASAAEAISENGYWGVEKTSERILDFAKALAGSDPSKIEMLKSAFSRGFDKAKMMFGGKLPEISQKTHDKVMEGFDSWEKEGAKKA